MWMGSWIFDFFEAEIRDSSGSGAKLWTITRGLLRALQLSPELGVSDWNDLVMSLDRCQYWGFYFRLGLIR